MKWFLVLYLFSNPNDVFVKDFSTEQECIVEKQTIEQEQNDDVKSVKCEQGIEKDGIFYPKNEIIDEENSISI